MEGCLELDYRGCVLRVWEACVGSGYDFEVLYKSFLVGESEDGFKTTEDAMCAAVQFTKYYVKRTDMYIDD